MQVPDGIDVWLGKKELSLPIHPSIQPRQHVIDELQELLKQKDFSQIKTYLEEQEFGKVTFSSDAPENIRLWLFGEGHDIPGQMSKQMELIFALNPENVLHEFLRNCQYDPQTDRVTKQNKERPIKTGRIKEDAAVIAAIFHVCKETRSSLIGCDFSDEECKEIMRTKLADIFAYERFEEFDFFTRKSNNEPVIMAGMEDEMMPIRDDHMCEVILKRMEMTQGPIVAILGSAHSTPIHDQKRLQGRGFDSVHINLNG